MKVVFKYYLTLAVYSKLVGFVLKPVVGTKGQGIRGWGCGWGYMCPGAEVLKLKALCICYVAQKKPTESENSKQISG